MDEKNIINLGNRYGAKNYLELVDEDTYALRFSDPQEGSWCRVGLAEGTKWEDHEYYFVDPSGGPFLSVGTPITEDKVVDRIYSEENTYYIKVTKKEEKDGKDA